MLINILNIFFYTTVLVKKFRIHRKIIFKKIADEYLKNKLGENALVSKEYFFQVLIFRYTDTSKLGWYDVCHNDEIEKSLTDLQTDWLTMPW